MTRRFLKLLILILTGWLAARGSLRADPTNPAPDFTEVYDLLRANLPGATDESLNRAAVEGLLAQFPGKVMLAGGARDGFIRQHGGTALKKSAVLENNVAYWSVGRIAGNLAEELEVAYRALTPTNRLVGAVLDLRFAGGDDYAAARETAKWLASGKPACPVAGPLVVLVNGETRGAAETLARLLHETDAALIIGSPTAGAALNFKEYVLTDGERLCIATPPGNPAGADVSHVQPDIMVLVNLENERAFLENPYGMIAPDSTNLMAVTNNFLPFVDHTSEADLVLQKRGDGKHTGGFQTRDMILPESASIHKQDDGGDDGDNSPTSRAADSQRSVIRDPVLARALDLVKGLAVVRESHL